MICRNSTRARCGVMNAGADMPPKEVRGTLCYGSINGEWQPIGGIEPVQIETSEPMNGLVLDDLVPMEGTFTVNGDFDALRKILIPQGMRNAAILKRDGFLDVTNGELD